MTSSCFCHSGDLYEKCCKPYHDGLLPENALSLMRSRYAAYALKLPSYIVATTHPASPLYLENHFSWKRDIAAFCKDAHFKNLEILDFKENDKVAVVVFTVTLHQKEGDILFTEKSYFEKFQGRWFYRVGHTVKGRDPSLIDEGPLKVLSLTYFGDPILKRKADPVSEISSSTLDFIEQMTATMDAAEGIGLAAPQVGHSLRIFMIRPVICEKDPFGRSKGVRDEVKVFINPVLSYESPQTWEAPEGCLSIPSLYASVERPKEIVLSYLNEKGETQETSFIGWEGRQVLHEFDHIEGILYPDRLSKKEFEKIALSLSKLEKRVKG